MRRSLMPSRDDPATVRHVAAALFVWAGLSLPLHLGWEVAQLPLYTLWRDADPLRIAWAVLHCTAGDVLIASSTFALVSVALRGTDWPARWPRRGLAMLLISGVAYTAFSEWFNVYRLGSWAYAGAMPTLWGIGLAPLLQWLIVPTLTLRLYVHVRRRQPMASNTAHPRRPQHALTEHSRTTASRTAGDRTARAPGCRSGVAPSLPRAAELP
ncbi:MAG: hypothetical protein J0L57_00510 [Burkholderiales bacterium]|nr:hypothetical protein [Burkholderiales bacterium]